MLKQTREVKTIMILVLAMMIVGVITFIALAKEPHIQYNSSVHGLLKIRVIRQTETQSTWVEIDICFYVVAGYLCIRELTRWRRDMKLKIGHKKRKKPTPRSITF